MVKALKGCVNVRVVDPHTLTEERTLHVSKIKLYHAPAVTTTVVEPQAVFANPAFELGMVMMLLLTWMLAKDGYSVVLLPSDFFATSVERTRALQRLLLCVTHEYRVGKWNYNPKVHEKPKRTCDSVFVMRIGKYSEQWMIVDKVVELRERMMQGHRIRDVACLQCGP